ncbi:CynX/NimT family MFS transporter [Homoserinibacter sp. GY 40078]|uniref:MFS transporter n=1 Tax=Homoserinibacter sp. GY 40078 TaxID=2603275 RepID=UPI0011CC382A|nr:MFS transporter [Homoserinibacter sp. GY 40078]TXK17326.1 MFS transporter [Homoserinibacter sp. GY 40078]
MSPRAVWAGRGLAFAGILLIAFNLRTAVAALSPILDYVGADLAPSAFVLALIGAAPPVAFAAGALLAPLLARVLGLEWALLGAVGAMVLGHLGRSLAPDQVTLTVATGVSLLGIGLGNVLLPPAVRRYFPDRVGLVTSIYATLLSVSTAIPPLIAVPIADAVGWRVSLAVWCVVAALAAPPWIAVLMRRRDAPLPPVTREEVITGPIEIGVIEVEDSQAVATEAAVEGRAGSAAAERIGPHLMRSPTAWAIAAIFGVSSLSAYASFAWLPKLLVEEAGVAPAGAGALLSLYAIMGFPAGLLVPVIAARFARGAVWLSLAGAVFFVFGYVGLLLAPAAAPALWVASAGLGPLLFPLALVLINLRSRRAATTIALSGFVQTFGYLVGATGPFVVGLLHDVTGGWTLPLLFQLAVVILIFPAAAILGRRHSVDDEL